MSQRFSSWGGTKTSLVRVAEIEPTVTVEGAGTGGTHCREAESPPPTFPPCDKLTSGGNGNTPWNSLLPFIDVSASLLFIYCILKGNNKQQDIT